MAPTQDKLEYFGLGARGQAIRHAYLIGGTDFEDKTYTFAEWPARKPTTPLGQLPVLTLDGDKQFVQSVAMLRFVGGRAGLYPEAGTQDQLIVEDILETINELWSNVPSEDKRREFLDTKVDAGLTHVERLANMTDSKSGSVLADLSVADLMVYGYVHFFSTGFFDSISADDFKKYETIQKICTSVKEHPKLKDYVAAGKV